MKRISQKEHADLALSTAPVALLSSPIKLFQEVAIPFYRHEEFREISGACRFRTFYATAPVALLSSPIKLFQEIAIPFYLNDKDGGNNCQWNLVQNLSKSESKLN